MKATLKHVANQYILIVDERPTINEWYLDDTDNVRLSYVSDITFWRSRGNYCKILAHENLDGVKGIRLDYKNLLEPFIGIESLIDTEVEVTEEEDYWVVRLQRNCVLVVWD